MKTIFSSHNFCWIYQRQDKNNRRIGERDTRQASREERQETQERQDRQKRQKKQEISTCRHNTQKHRDHRMPNYPNAPSFIDNNRNIRPGWESSQSFLLESSSRQELGIWQQNDKNYLNIWFYIPVVLIHILQGVPRFFLKRTDDESIHILDQKYLETINSLLSVPYLI